MKKIAVFKAKQKDDLVRILEDGENTFVKIEKLYFKFPFNFEGTIHYLSKLQII